MDNPYLELTEEFNEGRIRALISSGQAVVVHRLAIMSKDGDWVLRADEERLARYRAAAEEWASLWPQVAREIEDLQLPEAHRVVVARAENVLPFEPRPEGGTA